jgi:hypothetical protein
VKAEEEAENRAQKANERKAVKAGARQAIQQCDTLKTRRSAMNAEQAAICNSH